MDPLMEENFFIENPEKLENNFFNKEIIKDFNKKFKEKSQEITTTMTKKKKHHKNLAKKRAK